MFKKLNNIFDCEADVLVNPVNCIGVCGAGLALEFKKKYPKNYETYKLVCGNKGIDIGGLLINYNYATDKIIVNFPTKKHFKDKSEYSYIKDGLLTLNKFLIEKNIKSVAIPKLGCGLGGLDYKIVKQMIIDIITKENLIIYMEE